MTKYPQACSKWVLKTVWTKETTLKWVLTEKKPLCPSGGVIFVCITWKRSGWWFQLLWKIWVRQLEWIFHSQYLGKNKSPVMFQSPPTRDCSTHVCGTQRCLLRLARGLTLWEDPTEASRRRGQRCRWGGERGAPVSFTWETSGKSNENPMKIHWNPLKTLENPLKNH